MKEIIIETKNTVEDYIRFNMYSLEKYHKLKAQYLFLIIFGTFCIVFSFFSDSWYLLFTIGTIFILMRFLYPYRIAKRIRKYVKESPTLLTNGTITINEKEIIEVTSTSTMNMQWKDLFSFDEDKYHMYIFFSKIQAFIIHKELLTEAELNQIKEWKNQKN